MFLIFDKSILIISSGQVIWGDKRGDRLVESAKCEVKSAKLKVETHGRASDVESA